MSFSNWPATISNATSELLEIFLSEQLEQGLIGDVVIAQSDTQADRFWSVRHGIGEYSEAHRSGH